MRIEFDDGTAIWEWSDAVWSNGKTTNHLLSGDIVVVNEDTKKNKTVSRVIGDSDYRNDWTPLKDVGGAHPRGGVIYT
jgi:hypothetical protein